MIGFDLGPYSNETVKDKRDRLDLGKLFRERNRTELIFQDVRTLDGTRFKGIDLVIGSPPCKDFSYAGFANKTRPGRRRPDPSRGFDLILEFFRIVREAKPRYWAFENVRVLEPKIRLIPIWNFEISRKGKRSLWGNFSMPLVSEYKFSLDMESVKSKERYCLRSAFRAEIPYAISLEICKVLEAKPETFKNGFY